MSRSSKSLLAILLAVTFLVPLAANAAQWVRVSSINDRSGDVDKQSIQKIGDLRKFWVRYNFFEPQESSGKWYQSAAVHSLIDCNKRTFTQLGAVFYSEKNLGGNVVLTHDFVKLGVASESTESIIPGSSGETFYKFVCK